MRASFAEFALGEANGLTMTSEGFRMTCPESFRQSD
jgi:hypothetical protein